MADSYTLSSSSLEFPNMKPDVTRELYITITADGDNEDDIVFSVFSGLSAPFSLKNSEISITLSAGQTYDLYFVFAPTSYGVKSDSLHIHTTIDELDIPVSGNCTNYHEYTLPTIQHLACGDIACYLYVDAIDTLEGLSIPDKVNITSIGKVVESADTEPGVLDIENLTVDIADDYTDYSEGFWYHVIEGFPTADVQLMFLVGGEFLFRGSINREGVVWSEHFISGTGRVRSVSIQLVTVLHQLKKISSDDFLTWFEANYASPLYSYSYIIDNWDGGLKDCVKLIDIPRFMLCMIFGLELSETYAVARNTDILVKDRHNNTFVSPWTDCYLAARAYGGGIGLFGTYASGVTTSAWNLRFDNCHQILSAVCSSLAVIPRFYYGDSDGYYQGSGDKYSIELLTRGNDSQKVTMSGSILSSSMVSNSTVKTINVRASDFPENPSPVDYWIVNGSDGTGETAKNATIDTEIVPEITTYSPSYDVLSLHLLTHYTSVYEQALYVGDIKYYDYDAGDWVTLTHDAVNNLWCKVLASYMYKRFSKGRWQYERAYGNLLATNTVGTPVERIENIKIMSRIDINDGVSTKTYYATEVRKDIMNNTATVVWVEE